MTVTTMEILGHDGAGRPIISLDRATRDALAQYCRQRWPLRRRKSIAKEWDLSEDRARSVMEGNPSAETVDMVWKHPRGGWRVAAAVIGAVIGQSLEQHLDQELEAIRAEQSRLDELERTARTRWAALAARRASEDSTLRPLDAENRASDHGLGHRSQAPRLNREGGR